MEIPSWHRPTASGELDERERSGDIYAAGIDFAQRHDWTASVVLGCDPVPPWRGTWMPYIAGLRKTRADMSHGTPSATMLDIVESMCVGLLDHFPVSLLLGDSNHDQGSVDWLARRYGADRVDGVNFGTQAQMALWHDTLHYVGSPEGFPWPDPSALTAGTRTAAWCGELQEQITTEQVELNGRGQQSFYHPGEHNDFLHGFNLACMAMRRVQLSVAPAAQDVIIMPAQGDLPYRQDPLMVPEGMGGRPYGVRRGW